MPQVIHDYSGYEVATFPDPTVNIIAVNITESYSHHKEDPNWLQICAESTWRCNLQRLSNIDLVLPYVSRKVRIGNECTTVREIVGAFSLLEAAPAENGNPRMVLRLGPAKAEYEKMYKGKLLPDPKPGEANPVKYFDNQK